MQSERNLKHIRIMFQRIIPCSMKGKAKVWLFDSGSEWERASESGRDGPRVGIRKQWEQPKLRQKETSFPVKMGEGT